MPCLNKDLLWDDEGKPRKVKNNKYIFEFWNSGKSDVSKTIENKNNDVKAYSKLVLKIGVGIDFTRI